MNDEAIYAFNPVPEGPAAPLKAPAPKRRWWPWVLGGIALLSLLLVIGAAIGLASLLNGAHDAVHVTIDGDEWWTPDLLDGFSGLMALLGVGIGLLVALLCVLLVVPLTLVLVLLGLALGIGGAVLAVGLVAAVVLSPLWLLLLILWLLLRRPAPKVRVAS